MGKLKFIGKFLLYGKIFYRRRADFSLAQGMPAQLFSREAQLFCTLEQKVGRQTSAERAKKCYLQYVIAVFCRVKTQIEAISP